MSYRINNNIYRKAIKGDRESILLLIYRIVPESFEIVRQDNTFLCDKMIEDILIRIKTVDHLKNYLYDIKEQQKNKRKERKYKEVEYYINFVRNNKNEILF